MTQQLLTTLTICIVVQLLLLSVFLVTSKKGRRLSNFLLASFFGLLIINLADGILAYTGLYTYFPALAHLEDGFVFLFGPVLYFYALSIIYRDFVLTRQHLLHLIPFVVLTFVYLIYYHLQSVEDQIQIQKAILDRSLPVTFYAFAFLIYAHVCLYLLMAYRHLRYYRERIRDSFSSVEKISLDWISFMLAAFAFLLLISFIYTFVPAVGLKRLFDPLFICGLIFIFFFAISIVWRGLNQPEVFSGIPQQENKRETKYSLSIRNEERAQAVAVIREQMEKERVYLDPELTLEKLAERTSYTPKRLSQIINDSFQQNFFDFVNTFRIQEAERILRNNTDPRQTILEVMYASGFNSKSSFNSIFRQKTGMTPTEYRKSRTKQ
jgi:AraC-like DNA-binding protein